MAALIDKHDGRFRERGCGDGDSGIVVVGGFRDTSGGFDESFHTV